jgi:hypothetical protein
MSINIDDSEETFFAMCEMHWAKVLDMVKENAPEDLEVIEANKEICFKVFEQGIHVGWGAGVTKFVAQLKDEGFVTEHREQ